MIKQWHYQNNYRLITQFQFVDMKYLVIYLKQIQQIQYEQKYIDHYIQNAEYKLYSEAIAKINTIFIDLIITYQYSQFQRLNLDIISKNTEKINSYYSIQLFSSHKYLNFQQQRFQYLIYTIFYTSMGQCETCTQQLQYNAIDSDSLLQKISQLQLGKDIQKLRSDNQDYLSQYKFIIMPDRSMYKGKLVNSFKEGYGQLNSQQFNFYGFFREDKPSGIGAIVMEKKCIYGQFWNGVLEGRGKQWNQQYRFEGIFKKGERTEGTLIRDKDQLTYSGELKDNLYHGKGKLTTKVGACYQGDFIEGVFDGKGIFTFSNGNKYNGTFSKGKYHRYGEFAWTSGNYYKGQYCQGKRQGFGILMLDNVEYSGTWKNDVREGHGILSKQGDQVFGEWKQNHMIQS